MLMPVAQGGHQILVPKIIISSHTTNYNLNSDLQNNYGWNGSSAIEVELTINSGIYVYSTSPSTPAIAASLVSGSTLTINNSGYIIARGGGGGSGSPASTLATSGGGGGAGGNAINLANVTATINNLSGAIIAGGGGGGGGTGNARGYATDDAESGCTGPDRQAGGAAGGDGASQSGFPPTNTAVSNGGLWGQAGSGGSFGSSSGIAASCYIFQASGGPGGAAGKAISVGTGASRTLNNSGTTHGATS